MMNNISNPSVEQAEAEARACIPIETVSAAEVPALEAELAELSHAIDNSSAPLPPDEHDRTVADMAKLTAKLTIIDASRRNALRRRRVYGPVLAAEINRLASEIKTHLGLSQQIVRDRLSKVLRPHYSPDDLPVAVARATKWRAEVAFQNGISTGKHALRYVMEGGAPVLSPTCTAQELLTGLETARRNAEIVANHLIEVKAAD